MRWDGGLYAVSTGSSSSLFHDGVETTGTAELLERPANPGNSTASFKDEKRGFRRSSEAKLLPIEDERAEYKEAHRAAKKVVTKSHPGRMYTRRGELNKQESSDQLIESAEGLDC